MRVRSGINKGARWIAGSSLHSCWIGTFEAGKQDLLARLARPGMIAWDVGANAGYYTLALSRLVGEGGHVYAFEPYAENVDNLLRHVQLNGLRNTSIVQAALSSQTMLIGFQLARDNSMGFISRDQHSYLVPSLTVDDFVADRPDARPDLVKIDVEGAESDLLAGAEQLLRESSPEIILALHGREQSERCVDQLVSYGYSLYYMDGSSAGEEPLRQDEIYARKEVPRKAEGRSRRHSAES